MLTPTIFARQMYPNSSKKFMNLCKKGFVFPCWHFGSYYQTDELLYYFLFYSWPSFHYYPRDNDDSAFDPLIDDVYEQLNKDHQKRVDKIMEGQGINKTRAKEEVNAFFLPRERRLLIKEYRQPLSRMYALKSSSNKYLFLFQTSEVAFSKEHAFFSTKFCILLVICLWSELCFNAYILESGCLYSLIKSRLSRGRKNALTSS
jgi:hypothetical protein